MNKKEPFISVITPCFNVEEYLHDCVESILVQHFSNWELILVDDGSTDMTPQICDDYAAKDNRIIVIHQNNAGVSVARNQALDIARGEWITFIDSDDWFKDNAFDTFLKVINEEQCDRYIFNRSVVNDGVKLPLAHIHPSKLVRRGAELKWFSIDMLYPHYDFIINKVKPGGIRGVNANLYRKAVIEDNNIRFNPEIKIAEDAIFNYDVISYSSAVMMSDIDIGYYRVNQSSVMHKFTPNILEINDKTIGIYYSRIENLMVADIDFKRAFIGMVAECIFRALKLYFLHPHNTDSITERSRKLKEWITNNPLVKNAIDNAELEYLPIGKKQIMYAFQHNHYILGGVLGMIAIFYLKRKKEI